MNAAVDRVLGRALRGAAYYMVPNIDWEVSMPLHVVDYGIELDFDGVYLSLGWEDGTHQLHVSNSSMEIDFPSAEGHSIGSRPWDDMIGTRLVSARFGSGHAPAGRKSDGLHSLNSKVMPEFGLPLPATLRAGTS